MNPDGLIARLRKRRVFRSAGYYILGAWLILQVGDVIVEPAGLPVWTMTAVLYAVVIGFPVALFLGWRYDITDQGLIRTEAGANHPANPELLRLKPLDFAIIAGLLMALGIATWQLSNIAKQAEAPGTSRDIAAQQDLINYSSGSIAVLPFTSLSADESQRYLAYGISETVMQALAQVDGLDVTARTSSFAFEGQNLGIPEIGRKLQVNHLLEGSVQQGGGQVRIIARLINTQSGLEVWSENYDRGMDSVFDIQDEIAQEVTTALMVNVLGNENVVVSSGYQPRLAAFEELVLGRDAMEDQTQTGFAEAKQRFERAIEIDPGYPLAYVMLSRVSADSGMDTMNQRAMTLDRAESFVKKALDLDPLLPEAYIRQAEIQLARKQFVQAEQSAQRALELGPGMSGAYIALRDIYETQQRFDQALDFARKAVELDPETNQNRMSLARSLWDVGRSEAAIETIKEAINRHPELIGNYVVLSRQLRQIGRSGEALYWDRHALDLDPEAPNLTFNFCLSLLQVWAVEESRQCIEDFLVKYPDDAEANNYLALITRDVELGLRTMRAQVEANPDFWYRKMQLADWLARAELSEELIELGREAFPGLYLDAPEVQPMSIWFAKNLVQAYFQQGKDENANTLIDAALAHLDGQRKLQGTGLSTGTDDVAFLALRGDMDLAIERLREAIDRDWQFFSFGLIVPSIFPEALLAEPGFQEQVARQREIMKEEYAWYLANRDLSPSDLKR